MNRFLIIFSLILAFPSFGTEEGTVEITGRGEATHPPEYVTVRVNVVSLCYDTSRNAKDANAVLSKQLIEVMKKFATGTRDTINAAGGANVRKTEYIPDGTGKNKILCESKWRATNYLTLKLQDITQLPTVQDELLQIIDAQPLDPAKAEQSYAVLDGPSFGLFKETLDLLRKEAQSKAWADAKLQFEGLNSVCTFKNPRVKKVAQPSHYIHDPNADFKAGTGEGTPYLPEEIKVQATWTFLWTFEPSSECAFL